MLVRAGRVGWRDGSGAGALPAFAGYDVYFIQNRCY